MPSYYEPFRLRQNQERRTLGSFSRRVYEASPEGRIATEPDPEQKQRLREYYAMSPEQKRQKRIELSQRRQLRADLKVFDAEQQKFRDEVMNVFRQRVELGAAQQQRGIGANLGQFLERRGLEGGIAASLAETTQGRLGAQVAGAQADFNSALLNAMAAERTAFINKEFDFFYRIQLMGYENELRKDLARFQADLASDLSAKDAFLGVLQIGGAVLGGMFGGPAGAAAGYGAVEAAFPGGPAGQQAEEYYGA